MYEGFFLIIEFIGVPGGGKSFTSHQVSQISNSFFMPGSREINKKPFSFFNMALSIFDRTMKLISLLFIPMAFFWYRRFFIGLLIRVFNNSQIERIPITKAGYFILSSSYQFQRYCLAQIIGLLTSKDVYIDEGPLYGYIKFMTMNRKNISSDSSIMLEDLKLFDITAVFLDVDIEDAFYRFVCRDIWGNKKEANRIKRHWLFFEDCDALSISSWKTQKQWLCNMIQDLKNAPLTIVVNKKKFPKSDEIYDLLYGETSA